MSFDTAPGETLSRYIFQRNRIRSSDSTVRHTAFEPPPTGRLSVYWTTNLSNPDVWHLCQQYVEPAVGKPAIARADFNSLHVYAEELAVDLDGVPHERHANVIGWNLAEPTKTRLQAIKLASVAMLVRA
jgi:hypothetical protein